ncbi:hypothetical protein LZ575_19060 [Antarcticibacterium sp. 1MA-6-2]|nr:hypothetical protein [Antarcticibacterium sp. 1MA-6-2]UJH90815.1 hypothetical protein LZ575_19060 [Antarcticibacterium sp. 1MA-6-2]
MCNGANLCYKKTAFLEVEGFSGNENISSGDDVFLLQKFTAHHFPVAFLKSREATVFTKPQPDINSLISQRIRWAAKTPAYKSFFAKTLGLVILLMNLWILTGGIFVLFDSVDPEVLVLSFFLKFIFDLLLIFQAAKFFRRRDVLQHFLWSSILYPFFSVYVVVLSLFKGFEWKGRRFVR